MPRNHAAQGIALVIVLWMLVLLSAIAANFVHSTRTDTLIAARRAVSARAEALADAGIFKAIHVLAQPPITPAAPMANTPWKADNLPHPFGFADAEIVITISDESGKIDLNAASPALLKSLFLRLGVDDSTASALVDAIADWKDADDLRHANGAEAPDYLAAGLRHVPGNRPFVSLEELRQVLGMTDTLARRMAGMITVFSGSAGVNPKFAPREVLLALPGVDPAYVETYLTQRQTALEQGLPVPVFTQAPGSISNAVSNAFGISADARLSDGIRFRREAVIRMAGDPKNPFAILAWRAPAVDPGS